MNGILGFCNFDFDLTFKARKCVEILKEMSNAQMDADLDNRKIYISKSCALAANLETDSQPITETFNQEKCSLIFLGNIFNKKELIQELKLRGVTFKTNSDGEVVLFGHLIFGAKFVKKINGTFCYAIFNQTKKELTIFRDRMGVKPLFYTFKDGSLVFSSKIGSLLKYPGVEAELDENGLCEIFGLFPAKTPGSGVFRNIFEILPGCFAKFSRKGFSEQEYWNFEALPHEDSYEETVEKTKFLIYDSVKRQFDLDDSVCSFLSGGVDSSVVSSICAKEFLKVGGKLNTFSFDFAENNKYFKANSFQCSQDGPFAEKMVKFLKTNHTNLECGNEDLYFNLFKAVDARDLPCMADVESSLLFFCSKVSKFSKVALTGECADEIFGGYPWFYREDFKQAKTFPWSLNLNARKSLLSDYVVNKLPIEQYVKNAYETAVSLAPKLSNEAEEEKRIRVLFHLNVRWFMQTLLSRMDSASSFSGLEARVPFADYRLAQYIFNVPWNMKYRNKIVKGLLRKASKELLPEEVLYRKKSPYPKTYNLKYEQILKDEILRVVRCNNSPICNFLSKDKVEEFLKSPSNYGQPWYGQLMAGPQMIAYMLQVNYWLEKYRVKIVWI